MLARRQIIGIQMMAKMKELKLTKHSVVVHFTPEEVEALRSMAAQERRSVTNFVEKVVTAAIAAYRAQPLPPNP